MKRIHFTKLGLALLLAVVAAALSVPEAFAQQTTPQLPTYPLSFGAFVVRFDPGGTFTLQGQGWPSLSGSWKIKGAEIELLMSGGPGGCRGRRRYCVALSAHTPVLASNHYHHYDPHHPT